MPNIGFSQLVLKLSLLEGLGKSERVEQQKPFPIQSMDTMKQVLTAGPTGGFLQICGRTSSRVKQLKMGP